MTSRCHQARFLLRPTPEVNEAILEWLVRAQLTYPGVQILGFVAMSNHVHLLLFDRQAELASWASYFFGNLARTVNKIHKRQGAVFERRYSAEIVLDDAALIDRLAYLVTNPSRAGLCEESGRWPGLVFWAQDNQPHARRVSWVARRAYRCARYRAMARGEASPDPNAFRKHAVLVIHPLPDGGGGERVPDEVSEVATLARLREREFAAARKRAGQRAMTDAEVLSQPWHAAPRHPRRSPRPLCHASEPRLRETFREGYAAFVAAFRAAFAQWRRGDRGASFPPWSYPPGGALVRIGDPIPA